MTLYDERPYRPKIRGRRVYGRDEFSFRKLSTEMRNAVRGRGKGARARVATKTHGRLGRRVVVKAWYVKAGAGGASGRNAKLFLRYMEKDGGGQGGGRGELYGPESRPSPSPPEKGEREVEHGAGGAASAEGGPRPGAPDVVRGLEGVDPTAVSSPVSGREETALERELLEPLPGEKHQFRLVISPEDGHKLDLTKFTEKLMRQVEKDVGQPLIWAAVNHFDTDEPHVHVVVRGIDRDGRELRFDRAYISRIWRERAQELATRELGPRTELEYRQQLEREVRRGRFTSLDRAIAKRVVDGLVRSDELEPLQRERLKVLDEMGLAQEVSPRSWQLAEGWQRKLREDGERGDVIKQMFKALRVESSRYRIVRRSEALPRSPGEGKEVTGRVVSLGLIESTPGAMYAIVETARGHGYYVPLREAEVANLRRGVLVTLREQPGKWRRPVDQALVELAAERGGTVSGGAVREAVERRLEALRSTGDATRAPDGTWTVRLGVGRDAMLNAWVAHTDRGDTVDLEKIAATASRRLSELASLELATSSKGEMRLGGDLLRELERRDREQPRRQVGVHAQRLTLEQQITYIGPTWLDRAEVQGDSPFATDVVRALEQRRSFLSSQGVQPDELVRRERDRVAAYHARDLKRPVAKRAAGFRGTVRDVYEAHSGLRYAIVVSPTEVLVVRAGPKTRGLVGREVEVSFAVNARDGARKLSLELTGARPPER